MIDLLAVDIESYTRFIYYWGVVGIIASLSLFLSRQLPISSRVDQSALSFFGLMDKKKGWILMEMPILVAVLYFYLAGNQPINYSVVIVAAFVIHYVNRALIFPHRINVQGKTIPVSMVLMTMIFYSINGYLIGHYFGSLRVYTVEWMFDPRFIIGLCFFVVGFVINIQSDSILINLRKPGETDYKIPHGGLFKWVSCPNYFGEIVEWIGFAIMSWSLPGTMYALWVALALFATGLGTHRWYLSRFGGRYPGHRKAVIPFVI